MEADEDGMAAENARVAQPNIHATSKSRALVRARKKARNAFQMASKIMTSCGKKDEIITAPAIKKHRETFLKRSITNPYQTVLKDLRALQRLSHRIFEISPWRGTSVALTRMKDFFQDTVTPVPSVVVKVRLAPGTLSRRRIKVFATCKR